MEDNKDIEGMFVVTGDPKHTVSVILGLGIKVTRIYKDKRLGLRGTYEQMQSLKYLLHSNDRKGS